MRAAGKSGVDSPGLSVAGNGGDSGSGGAAGEGGSWDGDEESRRHRWASTFLLAAVCAFTILAVQLFSRNSAKRARSDEIRLSSAQKSLDQEAVLTSPNNGLTWQKLR